MHSFTILSQPSTASLNPSLTSNLRPFYPCLRKQNPTLFSRRKMARIGLCRAELSLDAPFAAAICGCILNSFVFPIVPSIEEEEEDQSLIDSTDTRFAAMGIISLIPYFNWMSWVFAWLDTGKIRYAVYALVYLAPYLRSNLSISPEDSWLPIASIILCIIHIQLETSIKNGDIQGFQFFGKSAKHFSSFNLHNHEDDEDTKN
ncbi:uncharacterized protein LOC124942601 [Impatiens glandulifera]|uniref:uncharacterized protein LOC124942601 n=1 Tax=Impatiens glandulifera TaxID=253017 RepID=UPI001FB0AAC3|nr:uncharacterized protein LOC124942601 [Impatiens glandulifera]